MSDVSGAPHADRDYLQQRSFTRRNHFCFIATATPDTYTLSLHDALPICAISSISAGASRLRPAYEVTITGCFATSRDRKSTRLNSSHTVRSYAVFCLKKKRWQMQHHNPR